MTAGASHVVRRAFWGRAFLGLAFVGLASCEVVTGFDDLEYEREACVPDSDAVVCADAECGTRMDNCGNEVTCADTCSPPNACGLGGVDENTCGCTGGLSHETPATPPECTLVTTVETGRSYYFCNPQSWESARSFCQGFGTDLVVINDALENELIVTNLIGKSWTGLTADQPCDPNFGCSFRWVDGAVLDGAYTNWNAGEPNNSGGGEFCVEMENMGIGLGRWNDVPCSNVLNVICETTCPDG